MKAFFVVAAVMAAAVASANAKAASIQEEHPIDWYDCSKKADGNYVHPKDCTRFISCSGGVASQRDCANCDVDAKRCPEGRTVYNATLDQCLWADETRCENGGGEGEDGPTNAPPVETTEADAGTTEAPSNPEPTEAPKPVRPKPGDACNPEDCVNDGYCQHYLRCDKDEGKWVEEECGENLVWNPLNPNGTRQVHGGNCDTWENLDPEVERAYRTDKECLACFWEQLGECNSEYLYQPANGTHRNVLRLSCSDGLVFSQEKETCQRCEDVTKADGTTTCC